MNLVWHADKRPSRRALSKDQVSNREQANASGANDLFAQASRVAVIRRFPKWMVGDDGLEPPTSSV